MKKIILSILLFLAFVSSCMAEDNQTGARLDHIMDMAFAFGSAGKDCMFLKNSVFNVVMEKGKDVPNKDFVMQFAAYLASKAYDACIAGSFNDKVELTLIKRSIHKDLGF